MRFSTLILAAVPALALSIEERGGHGWGEGHKMGEWHGYGGGGDEVKGTLTYNVTEAFQPEEYKKWRCLTTEKFASMLPDCLKGCQKEAATQDPCAYDDYACHCVNYQPFSDIIEPCAFPPAIGGHGTCTLAQLGPVRGLVTDMCNFMNATLYTPYLGCGLELSPEITFGLAFHEKIEVSY